MRVNRLVLVVLIHWAVGAEHGELYSSTDQLIELLQVGKDLVRNLTAYITAEEAILKTLKRVHLEVSEVTACVGPLGPLGPLEELEEHVSNPLTAYKLVRTLRATWRMMEESVEKSPLPEFLAVVKLKSQALPTDRDVDGIALGLIRLQDTYQLPPQSILGRDRHPGLVGTGSLDPNETFHIAMVAYKNHKYPLYLSWMSETLRQLDLGVDVSPAPFLSQMGNMPVALSFTQQLLKQDPSDMQAVLQQMHYSSLQPSVLQGFETQTLDFNMDSLIPRNLFNRTYEALCRGQGITMPPERQKRLLCRYGHGGGSVRLLYAPIKEQDEWDNPPIVRYLNLISDQEIDIIKRLSRPKVIEECCHCYCCET
ncbi:prolyl 4-hydroxylase subunit alpha-2-like [Clupea harengus]|uniref:Prolyl 4-hydroxylase subunit alpha-2-like n=1 Tax=Clupea harengus TaxID=7950 RepID=A0A8M1KPC3_CLUHA|nr:prolyl 4-hydroxylase subunit alpha-2-like [Clupea harengus]